MTQEVKNRLEYGFKVLLGLAILYSLVAIMVSIISGVASRAHSQDPLPQGYYPPYQPIPAPNNSILDPISQRANLDRIRVYQLEKQVEQLIQVVNVQHRQIHQMQQYVFYGRPVRVRFGDTATNPEEFVAGEGALAPRNTPVIRLPFSLLQDMQQNFKVEGADVPTPIVPFGSAGPGEK